MTGEREAMGPHEAHAQPPHEFHRGDAVTPSDDSLQRLARDLEQAGHTAFAARLAVLLEHDVHVLPQIEVSPPVPEPTLPEVAMVELTERVGAEDGDAFSGSSASTGGDQ